jgi:hypothetical protein
MTDVTTAEIISAALDALDIPLPKTIGGGERYLHLRSERATHLVTALQAIRDNPASAGANLSYLRARLAGCPTTTYKAWRMPA